jgi:hypothetical protein
MAEPDLPVTTGMPPRRPGTGGGVWTTVLPCGQVLGADMLGQQFADHPGTDLLDRAGRQGAELERAVGQTDQAVDGQADRCSSTLRTSRFLPSEIWTLIHRLADWPPASLVLALSMVASTGP